MRQNEEDQDDQGFEDQIPYDDGQDMEGQEQYDPNQMQDQNYMQEEQYQCTGAPLGYAVGEP